MGAINSLYQLFNIVIRLPLVLVQLAQVLDIKKAYIIFQQGMSD